MEPLVHRYSWNQAEKARVRFLLGFYGLLGVLVLVCLLSLHAYALSVVIGVALLLLAVLTWVGHARRDGEVLAEVTGHGIRIGARSGPAPWSEIAAVHFLEIRSTYNSPRHRVVLIGVDGTRTTHRVDLFTSHRVAQAVRRIAPRVQGTSQQVTVERGTARWTERPM